MNTETINEMHDKKLEEMKHKILGSSINNKLQLKAISNTKIDEIIQKMNAILTPRKVWEDFNFRTGKILGIMRSIAQNPKLRKELLEATGLTSNHIDLYFEYCGNLPYLITGSNVINPGRDMRINETKELITLIGLEFGYIVEESDLYDITEERWNQLYYNTIERLTETAKHNQEHAEEIPTQYDE